MAFLWVLALFKNVCAFGAAHTYPSLFFKDEEVARLHESNQETCGALSLSAILYYDESHWSLWINDKIICPENAQEMEGFHIKKVSPHEVEFSHLSTEGEILETFTLRPY